MIAIKKLNDLSKNDLDRLFNRFGEDFTSIMINTVVPIVNDVKKNGDKAVKKYTEKFDKVKLNSILVTEKEIDEGHKNTPKEVLDAFMQAKENIEEFHRRQIKENLHYTRKDGTTLGIKYDPIEKAAIYAPGGKATYPSSILMGIIPAQIAGTKEITLITPPGPDGKVPNTMLAICRMLGINRIIKSGGAQAIAAAAFGTESINKSDIIVGPGNIFVTAAKTYLFSMGIIQIDSMAGPSEVLIIADENANAKWVAYDMLSQAEHDEMAIAILVTTSETLALEVQKEIIKDIKSKSGRAKIKEKSIKDNGLILIADSISDSINFSNKYAPEHMEFIVHEPLQYLEKINNVGSLFMGNYAPVAVGDYFSGTNHILPTGGACRFSSGTSVETFLRRTTYQQLTEKALKKALKPVEIMSKIEGFDDKHGGSIRIRFEK